MTPQEWLDKGNDPSTYYCRNRKTPFVLSGLFTSLTRSFFSDKDCLYPNVLGWDPKGKCGSSVYIEGSNIWTDGTADWRPAVIVDVGDLKMNSHVYEGQDQRTGFNLREGESEFERSVESTIVWACLGKNKGQAQLYASNVYDLFDGFALAIKNDFCFDSFDLRAILRPRLRKESPEDWESLVQATFKFREGFTVKTESPKLKTISLRAVVNASETTQTV